MMSSLLISTAPMCCNNQRENFHSNSTTILNNKSNLSFNAAAATINFKSVRLGVRVVRKSQSSSNQQEEEDESLVEDLRIPDHWLLPSKALEESEWLRVTLHGWLDDEYCPEDTNVEISKVAAQSYYESLLEKQTDLGEILLKMASELESISYRESFHGAFSSANAAISLILRRIEQP